MVIYPWSNNEESRNLPFLKQIEDLPATLPGIREYFSDAFLKKQGGVLYVNVFIGHDRPFIRIYIVNWVGGSINRVVDGI